MVTLLLEWTEAFGESPPEWIVRFVEDEQGRSQELIRVLAGASEDESIAGRDTDELLVEILAGLPADSDLVGAIDETALAVLRSSTPGDAVPISETLLREALFRLLRAAAHVADRLPGTVDEVQRQVESGSHLALPRTPAQDLAAEALHVVARSQTDRRFVPMWWRLCDLDASAPEHALFGVLGLRWAEFSDGDEEELLAAALSRIANACTVGSREELFSESRSRRLFLTAARTTLRARKDLDAARIGAYAVARTSPSAMNLVMHAFGLAERQDAGNGGATSARYEDPERASRIAASLKALDPNGRRDADAFLEHQRHEAARRGDVLPLVQSLCYFANAVTSTDPALAVAWASEAADWQPHNHYTAVTWAEGLVSKNEPAAAADVLLQRLQLLAEHAPMWVELGARLQELGELFAAEEALLEAVERFPHSAAAWGAAGEFFVRTDRLASALAAFRSGLEVDSRHRYLLPGYVRALGRSGDVTEAAEVLANAEAVLGANHPVVRRRRAELRAGRFDVRELPASETSWLEGLSSDGLGTVALLLRRNAARKNDAGESSTAVMQRHDVVLRKLSTLRDLSLAAGSELALSQERGRAWTATLSVQELLRVRARRDSLKGAEYTTPEFGTMLFESERAGVTDQRFMPIHALSRLRAAATMVDGKAVESHARDAVEALRALEKLNEWRTNADGGTGVLTLGQRRSAWAGTALALIESLGLNRTCASLISDVRAHPVKLDAVEEDAVIGLIR
jgi:tetratricopeptide (TPR) repeat protein